MADTKTATKRAAGTSGNVWSDEERAVMQESARERRVAARRNPADERVDGERDVKAKIAAMAEPERAMAGRIHEIVLSTAPDLVPKTYYGMPAYGRTARPSASSKAASKFKERYSTSRVRVKTRRLRRRRHVANVV